MRFAWRNKLGIIAAAALMAASARGQINPHTNIVWPANCNTGGGMVYNVLLNQCLPAGINWRGAWDPGTTYATNDAVLYLGSGYIATGISTGVAPPAAPWAGFIQSTFNGGTVTNPITAPGFVGPLTGHASLDLPLTGGTLSGPLTTPMLTATGGGGFGGTVQSGTPIQNPLPNVSTPPYLTNGYFLDTGGGQSTAAGYNVFGDSNSRGPGSSFATSYASDVANDIVAGGTAAMTMLAVSGDNAADFAVRAFNVVSPTDLLNKLETVSIGTNNAQLTSPAQIPFTQTFLAGATWRDLSITYKVLADDATHVTPDGSWAAATAFTGASGELASVSNAIIALDTGACLVGPTGSMGVWYGIYTSSTGSWELLVDGTPAVDQITGGSTISSQIVAQGPANATPPVPAYARYTGLTPGSHTCSVKTMSAGNTLILGWAFPTPQSSGATGPNLAVLGVPIEQHNLNSTNTSNVNDYLKAAVAAMLSDGYWPKFVDIRPIMDAYLDFDGSPGCAASLGPPLHYNACAAQKIAKQIEYVVKASSPTSANTSLVPATVIHGAAAVSGTNIPYSAQSVYVSDVSAGNIVTLPLSSTWDASTNDKVLDISPTASASGSVVIAVPAADNQVFKKTDVGTVTSITIAPWRPVRLRLIGTTKASGTHIWEVVNPNTTKIESECGVTAASTLPTTCSWMIAANANDTQTMPATANIPDNQQICVMNGSSTPLTLNANTTDVGPPASTQLFWNGATVTVLPPNRPMCFVFILSNQKWWPQLPQGEKLEVSCPGCTLRFYQDDVFCSSGTCTMPATTGLWDGKEITVRATANVTLAVGSGGSPTQTFENGFTSLGLQSGSSTRFVFVGGATNRWWVMNQTVPPIAVTITAGNATGTATVNNPVTACTVTPTNAAAATDVKTNGVFASASAGTATITLGAVSTGSDTFALSCK